MMTRMRLAIELFLLMTLINGQVCNAAPIPISTAERLQELGEISSAMEKSQPLRGEHWEVIEKSLESADDVSVAVAMLILQHIDSERSRVLLLKYGASDVRRGMLSESVLILGRVTSELANAEPEKRVARWREMAEDPNPFSRISAAKELCAIDSTVAKSVLLRLEEEKSEISAVANRIRRGLAAHLGEEPPPPMPGTETLYTWFERSAGALASVQFDAHSGGITVLPHEAAATQTPPFLQPTALNKTPAPKPTTRAPSEDLPSPTPWSIILLTIVAASGLLWLLVKKRK